MAERSIGTSVDLMLAVRNYDFGSGRSADACALYGRCCQTSRGVPLDSALAEELFQAEARGQFDSIGHRGRSMPNDDRVILADSILLPEHIEGNIESN
jgi:hypothetical protein